MPLPVLPPGNDLSNREIAIAFWLVVLIVAVLVRADIRRPVIRVFSDLLRRVLLLSMASMLAWVVLIVTIGQRLGLWTGDLVKDTAIWFITFALVRLFRMANVGREPHVFRDMIIDPLTATALVEFITNLYVFPLVIEVALIPVATVLALLALVAARQKETSAQRLANGALVVIGIGILAFTGFELVRNWSRIHLAHEIRLLLLPIWLTGGTVPYLYFMSLLAGYESAFLRIRFASPNRKITWRSRLAMLSVLNVRTRAVANFRAPWIGRLADATSFTTARETLVDYMRNVG